MAGGNDPNYMRAYRASGTEAADRAVRAQRARDRALRALADRHPREFSELYDAERAKEKLPPARRRR